MKVVELIEYFVNLATVERQRVAQTIESITHIGPPEYRTDTGRRNAANMSLNREIIRRFFSHRLSAFGRV